MRLFNLLPAVVLAVTAIPAHAQQLEVFAPTASSAPASPRLKSPRRAQLLAIGHTALASAAGAALMSQGVESQWKGDVGYWLFSYGALLAPSAGSFYARDKRRTSIGLTVRSAGATLVVASLWGQLLFSPEFDMDNPDGGDLHWDALNVSGGALILTGAAYSILTAPRSVAEYNERAVQTAQVRAGPAFDTRSGAVGVQFSVRH
jgi:hypothetical protein